MREMRATPALLSGIVNEQQGRYHGERNPEAPPCGSFTLSGRILERGPNAGMTPVPPCRARR